MGGVGAEWQGARNAQPGHDEVWTEAAIFSQAEAVDEVRRAAAKSAAKFCGEIVMLVLRIFHPQKNCHQPSANFTAALWRKIWCVTAYFVRGLRN